MINETICVPGVVACRDNNQGVLGDRGSNGGTEEYETVGMGIALSLELVFLIFPLCCLSISQAFDGQSSTIGITVMWEFSLVVHDPKHSRVCTNRPSLCSSEYHRDVIGISR